MQSVGRAVIRDKGLSERHSHGAGRRRLPDAAEQVEGVTPQDYRMSVTPGPMSPAPGACSAKRFRLKPAEQD